MRIRTGLMSITVAIGIVILLVQVTKSDKTQEGSPNMATETTGELTKDQELATAKAWAVQINVTDIDAAIDFYTKTLGLTILSKAYYPQVVSLRDQGGHILLYSVKKQADQKTREYRTIVNFQVASLAETTKKLNAAGSDIISKSLEKNAIGHHLVVADPSGNVLHLMELDEQFGTIEETKLFNIGIHVNDLDKAIDFYESKLGMKVMTHKYWPPILPLICEGIEVVLHQSDKIQPTEYPNATGAFLILESDDLAKSVAQLTDKGLSFEYDDIIKHAPVGKYTAVRDPFGSVIELIEPAPNPLDEARRLYLKENSPPNK